MLVVVVGLVGIPAAVVVIAKVLVVGFSRLNRRVMVVVMAVLAGRWLRLERLRMCCVGRMLLRLRLVGVLVRLVRRILVRLRGRLLVLLLLMLLLRGYMVEAAISG